MMVLEFVELMPFASLLVDEAMAIRPDENAVIVTDTRIGKYPGIGQLVQAIAAALAERGIDFNIITFKARNIRNQSMPAYTEEIIRSADTAIILLSQSFLYTEAWQRIILGDKKARIITLPLGEDVNGTDDIYYKLPKTKEEMYRIVEIGEMLEERLMKGHHTVRVSAPNGTDLTFRSGERRIYLGKGIVRRPNEISVIPAGGISVGVNGGSANGTIVFDQRFNLFKTRYLESPIICTVENGHVTKLSGGIEAKRFEEYVRSLPYPREQVLNIAEFGVGFNNISSFDGVDAGEWEQVYGASHIGIGADAGFGGQVAIPFHEDGMIAKSTVTIDGEDVCRDGEFIL